MYLFKIILLSKYPLSFVSSRNLPWFLKKKKISLHCSQKPQSMQGACTHAYMCRHIHHPPYICDTILMISQSSGILAVFKHLWYILVTALMISHFISFRTHGWIPSGPGDLLHRVPQVAPSLSPQRPKNLCQGHSLLHHKMCPWNRSVPIVFSNKYSFKVFI